MNLLRSLLLDNLGLKLVALLMAVAVYLYVYTERPASMIVSFPLRVTGLGDTLALSGPVPASVQAELRGTGKQLIRLRVTEPQLEISLAGATPGRFERAIGADDLPLGGADGVSVERIVGPRLIELQLDKRGLRVIRVAARIDGAPAAGWAWDGTWIADPPRVAIRGPRRDIAGLDSLVLDAVRIDGRRDTLRVRVGSARLPEWCVMEPPTVLLVVPVRREPGR